MCKYEPTRTSNTIRRITNISVCHFCCCKISMKRYLNLLIDYAFNIYRYHKFRDKNLLISCITYFPLHVSMYKIYFQCRGLVVTMPPRLFPHSLFTDYIIRIYVNLYRNPRCMTAIVKVKEHLPTYLSTQ